MTKPTMWLCAQRRQFSLGIHPVWSVFAVRMKKAWVLSCPFSTQRRLWSDWVDAQTDLSLRWTHSFCWFCHVVAHIMYLLWYSDSQFNSTLTCVLALTIFKLNSTNSTQLKTYSLTLTSDYTNQLQSTTTIADYRLQWKTHPKTHPPTHSLTHPVTHSLTHYLPHSLTHSHSHKWPYRTAAEHHHQRRLQVAVKDWLLSKQMIGVLFRDGNTKASYGMPRRDNILLHVYLIFFNGVFQSKWTRRTLWFNFWWHGAVLNNMHAKFQSKLISQNHALNVKLAKRGNTVLFQFFVMLLYKTMS